MSININYAWRFIQINVQDGTTETNLITEMLLFEQGTKFKKSKYASPIVWPMHLRCVSGFINILRVRANLDKKKIRKHHAYGFSTFQLELTATAGSFSCDLMEDVVFFLPS
ncbi:MAG: hypothetical protein K0R78_1930 [Pelosinus sp.]|jgi:hypothetical protein|nr:hypothetical protein [Pelosinus sp.]